jgi:hypothetical protein
MKDALYITYIVDYMEVPLVNKKVVNENGVHMKQGIKMGLLG